MRVEKKNSLFELSIKPDELRMLVGCMNEALELEPSEFQTRTGYDHEDVRALMKTLADAERQYC